MPLVQFKAAPGGWQVWDRQAEGAGASVGVADLPPRSIDEEDADVGDLLASTTERT
jgi:hypothetical protein